MKPPAKIPVSLLRGGTSKAVLVSSKDLPTSPSQREALLLNLLGQANVFGQQINGLGGGHASASKLAIVGPSTRNDCDVDFTFGALNPSYSPTNTAKINWSSSCTHTVAAVALFAIDQALLVPNEHSRAATQSTQKTETLVRIWQVNLGQVIHAYVPMHAQQIDESSEVMESNQAMRGALVRLEFFESSFLQSSPWLPTAHTKQNISLGSHGKLEVTLLGGDCPAVLLRADELGLSGKETTNQLAKNAKLAAQLAAVKNHATQLLGFSAEATPIACVLLYKSHAYQTLDLQQLTEVDTDLVIRLVQLSNPRQVQVETPSDALLFAVAVACAIPGTIAHEIARTLPGIETRIGHSNGVAAIGAQVQPVQASFTELELLSQTTTSLSTRWVLERAIVLRSARRLLSGTAYVS